MSEELSLQEIAKKYNAIVIKSKFCFFCLQPNKRIDSMYDLVLISIDEKDRDEIPFERMASPIKEMGVIDFQYLLDEFGSLIVSSDYCLACQKYCKLSEDLHNLAIITIDDKDKDLLPFDSLAINTCVDCIDKIKGMNKLSLFQLIVDGLEVLECEIIQ